MKRLRETATAAQLRSDLNYDKQTGIFTRAVSRGNMMAGKIAGTKMKCGYIRIRVKSELYLAHRLAWLYVYGMWPEKFIDHINGVKTDNRISNLRDVSFSINMQNQRLPRTHNKSKFRGVSKNGNFWRARICIDKKEYVIGKYATPEMAHEAYISEKRKHHAGCTI